MKRAIALVVVLWLWVLATAFCPAKAEEVCRVQWDNDGACSVMPPPGTGLVEGKGWVHCAMVGPYTLRGGLVYGRLGTEPAGWRDVVLCGRDPSANRGAFSQIQQTGSSLEWTRPDGVREPIPVTALYGPM